MNEEKVTGVLRKKIKISSEDDFFKERTEIHYFVLNLEEMTFGFTKKLYDENLFKCYGYKQVLCYDVELNQEDLNLCEWSYGFQVSLYKNKVYVLFCESNEELIKWLQGFRIFFEKKNLKLMKKSEVVLTDFNEFKTYESIVRNEIDISYNLQLSEDKEDNYEDQEEKMGIIKTLTNKGEEQKKVIHSVIVKTEENLKTQFNYELYKNNFIIKTCEISIIANCLIEKEKLKQESINKIFHLLINFLNFQTKLLKDFLMVSGHNFMKLKNLNEDWTIDKNLYINNKNNIESLRNEIKRKRHEEKINNSHKITSNNKKPYIIKMVDINNQTLIDNIDLNLSIDEYLHKNDQIKKEISSFTKTDLNYLRENEISMEKNLHLKLGGNPNINPVDKKIDQLNYNVNSSQEIPRKRLNKKEDQNDNIKSSQEISKETLNKNYDQLDNIKSSQEISKETPNKNNDQLDNIKSSQEISKETLNKKDEKLIIKIKDDKNSIQKIDKFTNFPGTDPEKDAGQNYYDLYSHRKHKNKDDLHLVIDTEDEKEKLNQKIQISRQKNKNNITNKINCVNSPHFGNISIISQRFLKVDNIDDWKQYINLPNTKNMS